MAGIFGSKPDPVVPKPAAPMPDDQSPAVLEAKRKEREKIMSRGGRASTILTTPESRGSGGFDSYGSTTLGSGA
jgi:hypothetical protein